MTRLNNVDRLFSKWSYKEHVDYNALKTWKIDMSTEQKLLLLFIINNLDPLSPYVNFKHLCCKRLFRTIDPHYHSLAKVVT